jgi:hypothetical protein
MIEVRRFNPFLAEQLPDTYALLEDGGLRIHGSVDRVTLHGSRGPRGGARPDSDLDLCLAVSATSLAVARDQSQLLREVLVTTLDAWQRHVDLDLAAMFDKTGCGLRCLDLSEYSPCLCPSTVDCVGLFKIQKGFDGFVSESTVDCRRMYPLMEIWTRPGEDRRKEQKQTG